MPRENKTKETNGSVENYFAAIKDNGRRKDCETLAKLMAKATKQKPKMWGSSIVGFGSYHYRYDSGREGDNCLVGFSSRKDAISIYLTENIAGREQLLANLGKHKIGKACLSISKLSDIDPKMLEQLVVSSVAERKRKHS